MARNRFVINTRALQRDLKKVERQLDAIKKQGRPAANGAMRNETKKILERSRQLVPVRTGALRDSARLTETRKSGGSEFEISFNTPYASRIHERTDLKHKRGRAKYLEIAAKEQSRGLAKRVANKINRALRKIAK